MSDLNTPEDKLNWIFTAFDQVFIQRSIHSELSVFQTFFICYLNSCICVRTTSPRSPHLLQDGGGSIDVEEIRDIVVGLFRFCHHFTETIQSTDQGIPPNQII